MSSSSSSTPTRRGRVRYIDLISPENAQASAMVTPDRSIAADATEASAAATPLPSSPAASTSATRSEKQQRRVRYVDLNPSLSPSSPMPNSSPKDTSSIKNTQENQYKYEDWSKDREKHTEDHEGHEDERDEEDEEVRRPGLFSRLGQAVLKATQSFSLRSPRSRAQPRAQSRDQEQDQEQEEEESAPAPRRRFMDLLGASTDTFSAPTRVPDPPGSSPGIGPDSEPQKFSLNNPGSSKSRGTSQRKPTISMDRDALTRAMAYQQGFLLAKEESAYYDYTDPRVPPSSSSSARLPRVLGQVLMEQREARRRRSWLYQKTMDHQVSLAQRPQTPRVSEGEVQRPVDSPEAPAPSQAPTLSLRALLKLPRKPQPVAILCDLSIPPKLLLILSLLHHHDHPGEDGQRRVLSELDLGDIAAAQHSPSFSMFRLLVTVPRRKDKEAGEGTEQRWLEFTSPDPADLVQRWLLTLHQQRSHATTTTNTTKSPQQ